LNAAPDAFPWQKVVCVFTQLGYRHVRTPGSAIILEKPGVARPLVVPRHSEIRLDILRGLMRTAGITREAFLSLLENC
jgi:predicted RNA binding protein YcfA (HicA-like mRNA interferase family)